MEGAKEMMGNAFESKDTFFDGVFKRLNVPSGEPELDSALASSKNEDDGTVPESEEEDLPILGTGYNQCPPRMACFLDLHRVIHEPVVRLPPIFGGSTPPCVFQGHPSVEYPPSIEQDESLLALNTDEKLFEELREEVELDR